MPDHSLLLTALTIKPPYNQAWDIKISQATSALNNVHSLKIECRKRQVSIFKRSSESLFGLCQKRPFLYRANSSKITYVLSRLSNIRISSTTQPSSF